MEIIKRQGCRALLLTPEHEVLLIRIANPTGDWEGWVTPGGGVEPGEDEETALRRELHEEVGLRHFDIGPQIWTRVHRFSWDGRWFEQSEVYYLVHTEWFLPQTENLTATEMHDVKETRWWTLNQLKQSSEIFAPRDLFVLLNSLTQCGPPPAPIAIGA